MPKITDAVKRFTEGAFIVIAEYRGFKPDAMRYRDKKTGNRVSSPILVHSIEVGASQVKVTEWLPDDAPVGADGLPTATQPFKKGDKVVLQIENLENERGQYSARGKLFAIDKE